MHANLSDDKIRRMIELARGHMEAGGVGAAGVYYRMILKDTAPPKSGVERIARGEACLFYARKSLGEKSHGAATDWYRKALEAYPLAIDYSIEYCIKTLIPMALYKMARIEAEAGTRIEPQNPLTWKLLGDVQHVLCDAKESIRAYDKAIALAPDKILHKLDRATIALDVADYDTVRAMIK